MVWLRGEHDLATKVSLVAAITGAVERDDADLLVDLSEVTFMDASTVGAIVTSRRLLQSRLLSLELRAPSPTARRLLDLCGLVSLVHLADSQATHPAGAGAALSTWVDVLPVQAIEDPGDEITNAQVEVEVDRNGP